MNFKTYRNREGYNIFTLLLFRVVVLCCLFYITQVNVIAQSLSDIKVLVTPKAHALQEVLNQNFTDTNLPHDIDMSDGKGVYWVSFSIMEDRGKDVVLEFFDWSNISLFYKQGSKWQKKQTGTLVPFRDRDTPIKNRLLINVPAYKGTYYVKLEAKPNSIKHPETIKIITHTPQALLTASNHITILEFFVNGALFCVFIFSIVLFSLSKDKGTLILSGYLLLWMYSNIHNNGTVFPILSAFESFPRYFLYMEVFTTACHTILAIFGVYALIEMKRHFSWEKRFFDLLVVLLALFPLLALIIEYQYLLVMPLYIVVILAVIGIMYLSLAAIKKEIHMANLFFVANSPFFIGVLIFACWGIGLLNISSDYTNLILLIGVLIQTSFFAVMFSLRIEHLKFTVKKSTNELRQQGQQLSAMSINLERKNMAFAKAKEQAQNASRDSEVGQLLKMIEQDLNFESNWDEFKLHFERVNPDFFEQLLDKHPTLTHNEQRLCAYLKLNLSTKEIAELLHRSLASVEKARYRLRKKMGLDNGQNLSSYIHKL